MLQSTDLGSLGNKEGPVVCVCEVHGYPQEGETEEISAENLGQAGMETGAIGLEGVGKGIEC